MPPSLADTLRRFVSPTFRSRGESYYERGRVIVLQDGATEFTANVRGTRLYAVSLALHDARLVVKCTCPYFDQFIEPCKHIWAVIIAADRVGKFRVPQHIWIDAGDDGADGADPDEYADADEVSSSRERQGRKSPSAGPDRAELMKRIWRDRQQRAATVSRPALPTDMARSPQQQAPSPPPARPAPPPTWRVFLADVTFQDDGLAPKAVHTGEILYVVDLARSEAAGAPSIEILTRDRKKSGEWSKPRPVSISRHNVAMLPDERDRRLLDIISGATVAYAWDGGYLQVPSIFQLNPTLQRELVPQLCETGRLLLRGRSHGDAKAEVPLMPIAWDPRPASFEVVITADRDAGYTIHGRITGVGDETLDAALLVTEALVLLRPERAGDPPRFAVFDTGGAERWVARLRMSGPITVPAADAALLIEALANADLARVDCPPELRADVRAEPPRPIVRIARRKGAYYQRDRLDVTVSFAYGRSEVEAWSPIRVVFDREQRMAWRRDRDAERDAMSRLQGLGVRRRADWASGGTRYELAEKTLPTLVRVLLAEGWRVEADGRLYRQAVDVTLEVRSGIDWFELHGNVDYGGVRADLPALLAAARRGGGFVPLGDGTFGVLPERWLARDGRIASLGTPDSDHVRFAPSQAALLDAWLATQPAVSIDEAFARARGELARFDGLTAQPEPSTFNGVLRGYQRDALGWLDFLRRFGFGGCLADEMGLGKTVMVIATLEARRLERARDGGATRPSLIVVPRSLMFNWTQEAARFAPALRVLDYTGGARRDALEQIGTHDIALTTYGTLRRDIGDLKEIAFDYVILDEAQAIKNARTSSAKAARLLKADHRLALSGTPVENHLGELWSLFEFLNPGVLGASSIFSTAGAAGRAADDDVIALLAKGLRPFILRRTKDQVARELPPRTEQTLFCDLEPPQRALYDELRDHYRASLLGTIARDGLGRSKLQILEALLRLRQAACHPGLIDPARAADAAAKLDVLVPRLQELVEDGRQVLVFSQFTTLLGLLRTRLDDVKMTYEYLDGKTRDRRARVERFQNGTCPVFLISLKAGGLGLNLTAAEYVFLLDPWWNPAVEAQAIDRAHRIGQTRPVFAFRLIARNTVEEKIIELQATKRRLADAIVKADEGLIRDLRREDLELLLS